MNSFITNSTRFAPLQDPLTHLFMFVWFLYLLQWKFKQTPHYYTEIYLGNVLFEASFC